LVLGIVFAQIVVWSVGTVTVFYAIFKPRKVATDRKAKSLLVVYFINAALFGLARAYPAAADAAFQAIKGVLLTSAPYAEGGVAVIVLGLIWLSPAIVGGFIVWLLIDAISSATASKIRAGQKDRQ